jgi:uncharacterized membrane protein YqhA
MLNFGISLRYFLLIPVIGAGLGALLLFWEGAVKIANAAVASLAGDAKGVISSVMSGTDTFLFGIVLAVFSYAIAFGFVLNLPQEERAKLPSWMRVGGVHELKNTLVEVILVYLIVDFVTDWPETTADLPWQILVKPISIFLIAAAFYLFTVRSHSHASNAM